MYISPTSPAAARAMFPTLPKGMERDGLVALIDAVAPRLGIGSAALATFRAMIALTRPRAFKTGGEEPCCYANQSEVARRRGVAPSRIRAHERTLEAAGLIEKRTMANGARSGFSGCGIYFTCTVARVREFLEVRSAAEEDRQARTQMRNQRSIFRRRLRAKLDELGDEVDLRDHVDQVRSTMGGWPSAAALQRLPRAALSQHLKEVQDLWISTDQLAAQRSEACGRPLENERCHIQDPIEDFTSAEAPREAGSGTMGEITAHAAQDHKASHRRSDRFGIPLLYEHCSAEMRFYIDAWSRGGELQWRYFSQAVGMRLIELNVPPALWDRAVTLLGEYNAVASLIVFDGEGGDGDKRRTNVNYHLHRAIRRRRHVASIDMTTTNRSDTQPNVQVLWR